ncbi:GMC family oxidoreductase [Ruegeria sp. R13_0]|uniref:FAD-dependent oxidoreductase n=1 Tax=Ruegeria sp. R13_0 TaxID=2821099 RepID=UPI001ADD1958|nr:GMC family oxidoreductase [Ruegeria sp. R13_0]MBO9432746.1 GMC family oxidoreductase [Ruegeria sp. R13_0]
MNRADVIIIGSGIGGATLAAALAPSGRRILILERGERLQPSPQDRDPRAIFASGHFRPDETWVDGAGKLFNPGNYYCVGGNSKFYGAALIRYRKEDFEPRQLMGGYSHGWPMPYEELETDYTAAEQLYDVRGTTKEDPTEPPHSGGYPHPPVSDEVDIADLRTRLSQAGLTPSSVPLGVEIETWLEAGQTTWDAFPNTCGGKMDAETCALAEALKHENVELLTNARVLKLKVDAVGRVTSVEVDGHGALSAPVIVLAAGAVQSSVLLLQSANDNFPTGFANRSDQVGRNFMNHNCSAVLALHPLRRNRALYQKTLMFNDYYNSDGQGGLPLGNIQMLGKITGPILASQTHLPAPIAALIANRSFDFYAMSEDLPNPESRVTVEGGQIKLDWKRSNWAAHEALVARLKAHLKQAGFPVVLSRPFDRRTPSHQCGTARMGNDPSSSVVDTFCRSHDHKNLFIVDASVLPTSAAVNPALTIAALALRAGRHIIETEFAA